MPGADPASDGPYHVDMDPSFRIRSDLSRVVTDGFAYSLGIGHPGERQPTPGWSCALRPSDETHPDTMTWTIVVSHELLRPLMHEFLRLLPDRVSGILELGSRDAYRSVDVFLGHEIDVRRFRSAWDLFDPLLIEDATLAVGVNASNPFFEVFIDQDKRLFVHAEPQWARRVEEVLARFQVPSRDDADLQIPPSALTGLQTRPILAEVPGMMIETDHLLLELRDAWDLVLDEDPNQNLDGDGREMGSTLWQGLVFVDQEDPAGRRHGHAHVWGVAECRRGMEQFICSRASKDMDWEFREILSLDRVAFDDRPDELDDLAPRLADTGVLIYRVEPLGTVPSDWTSDDG